MGLLSAIIFGLLAGLAARVLLPGPDRMGCVGTTIVGIVGAVIGQLLSGAAGAPGDVLEWSWRSFGFAILGAILLLVLLRIVKR